MIVTDDRHGSMFVPDVVPRASATDARRLVSWGRT